MTFYKGSDTSVVFDRNVQVSSEGLTISSGGFSVVGNSTFSDLATFSSNATVTGTLTANGPLNTSQITVGSGGEISLANSQFLGFITATAAPTSTAVFTSTGDWAFHYNTATSAVNLVFNATGAVRTVAIST